MVYLTYVMNYINISANFKNNTLYLNAGGTIFITIPDGNYDIVDLNRVLNSAIVGKYYKILSNLNGLSYSIYSYTSFNDWLQDINGTLEDPNELLLPIDNLNKELYDGSFRPDMFKIYCKKINSYVNVDNDEIQAYNYFNIPVSVGWMVWDTFEF